MVDPGVVDGGKHGYPAGLWCDSGECVVEVGLDVFDVAGV